MLELQGDSPHSSHLGDWRKRRRTCGSKSEGPRTGTVILKPHVEWERGATDQTSLPLTFLSPEGMAFILEHLCPLVQRTHPAKGPDAPS